jgi:solute:Na+ symporter, SSS family
LSVAIAAVIAWKSERVLSFYFIVTSIVAGGLAGLFLLSFLSPRANRQGAYIGIIACLLFTTWATITSGKSKLIDLGDYNFKWQGVMIGVVGHVVLVVVGYAASWLFPAPDKSFRAMTLWGWRDRLKSLQPAAAGAETTPKV